VSTPSTDSQLFVDDVVTALTGSVETGGDPQAVLNGQMRRATEEFDLRTAEAFARALLEALCQDDIDPRRLEALLILGLAHPTILEKHRISLQREGERLAALLQSRGQPERARCLLDVIQTAGGTAEAATPAESAAEPAADPRSQARVEALLREADEAGRRGDTRAAIHLLQEVVTLDRNRRDVARMIRDLRWAERDRRARWVRRLKFLAVAACLSAAVAAFVWRENGVRARYAAIPPAQPGDLASLRERLGALDELVAAERAWLGMGAALEERLQLQRDVLALEAALGRAEHEARMSAQRDAEEAVARRESGLKLARDGKYAEALPELRRALELGGPAWESRREVESNLVAIQRWLDQGQTVPKEPVR
jgi:tetratricopeptide (TPR) repeat protein